MKLGIATLSLLSPLLGLCACGNDGEPQTEWDFECTVSWYDEDPEAGEPAPLLVVTLEPYPDLETGAAAVELCAGEQLDHPDRPPNAVFHYCACEPL